MPKARPTIVKEPMITTVAKVLLKHIHADKTKAVKAQDYQRAQVYHDFEKAVQEELDIFQQRLDNLSL